MTTPAVALREFKDLLYGLYVAAGRPPFSKIADDAGRIAGELGAARGPSPVTVGAILSGHTGLPGEEYAVMVGVALGLRTDRDPATVGEQVRAAWRTAHDASRGSFGRRLGVSVGAADPFAFGVHRATRPGRERLPPYVRRPHDDVVAGIVAAARAGASRVLALVGRPGAGRSRAAWEAIRALPSLWRIWQPADGASATDITTALSDAGPYTIVWLTDAAHLLEPDPPLAEAPVVTALRALLDDPARAPVLVVLTLWPQQWTTLTARPLADELDVHADTRSLLYGNDVAVPDTRGARKICEVLRRYDTAPPAARALLDAAVDARRFGFPPWLSGAFLRHAAGDGRPADDVAAAIAFATATPALLTIHGSDAYRLVECVHHDVAARRCTVFPPVRFWDAVTATVTDPGTLRSLGVHAERRGRLNRAGHMYRLAIEQGDTAAMGLLVRLRERAGDRAGADRLAMLAGDHGDHIALRWLALRCDGDGDATRADTLATAAAARGDATVACALAQRHPGSERAEALYWTAVQHGARLEVAALAAMAQDRGDLATAETIARQAAATGDTTALQRLADARRRAGELDAAERLAVAAAQYGHRFERRLLAEERRRFGRRPAVESFLRRAAATVSPGDAQRLTARAATDAVGALAMALRLASRSHTGPLHALAVLRQQRGGTSAATRLAVTAARYGDPSVLAEIAMARGRLGDIAGAVQLAERAAELGDGTALRKLARSRRRTGDHAAATQLLRQAAAHGDPDAMFDLARARQEAGDRSGAEAGYRDAVRGGVCDAAHALALLRQDTDPPAAATFARRAADLGDPTALRDLGRIRELAGDRTAAADLYRQGSDRGDTASAQLLARLWDSDDRPTAAGHATTAAEQGDTMPMRQLADLWAAAGRQSEADELYWSAYEHGDADVLMRLPHMRAEERGDQVDADRLALQAADCGRYRAVADLGAARELTGDLAAAERLYLQAATAGAAVDLRNMIRLRLSSTLDVSECIPELYEHALRNGVAGAGLALARVRLARGAVGEAAALCRRAADRGEPGAVAELARLHRRTADGAAAALIDRYGLQDDGRAANSFRW
ncbi:hypothetical protein [Dactylosporangium sp. NPDC049140]|uniref:hypothetical protein n=1 Tax=Dactylosporangium sp. NPDC049140 TaxID=3155647 RepID=UPI0033C6E9DB